MDDRQKRRPLRDSRYGLAVPHSAHWAATTMLEHVVRLQPKTVVDIGYGYGKWGFLIREALDFVGGRHDPETWEVRIAGLDAQPVSSPLAEWIYNSTRQGDVLQEEITDADLVVLGDVIEHIEKGAGIGLLERLVDRNRCVLVNTPREFFQQDILGNPFERHLSLWRSEDFDRWPADVDIRGGTITAAIRGSGGTYPADRTVRASRLVRRIPVLRDRGAASTALKEGLKLVLR